MGLLPLRNQLFLAAKRFYTTNAVKPGLPGYESYVKTLLADLKPTKLSVEDVSGGCGSMFAISIASEQFRGIPMVKQHRLVNQALKDEISQWHGLQLKTSAPE